MPTAPGTPPPLPLADGIAGDLEPHLREPVAAPGQPSADERLDGLRGRSLRNHTARGVVINTGFLVGLSVLGLFRGFILAAFLSREDYGVWGILVVSLGTLLWLKQVGIGDKFIQQDEPDQELAFQKAFTLEAMFTGLFMLVLLAALPLIAVVYGEWRLVAPGLVVVALLPAGALQAPLWIYYRKMNYLRQRTLQAIDPVVGFVVAVGMAVAGAGYWAFAVSLLAGAWASALAAMHFSPYRLRFRYDRGALRSYASFSWPLFLASGSSMVIAQSAVITSKATLGLAGTGTITLASNITSFTQRVDGLVSGTLYPAVCAVRDRIDLLRESFVKSNRLALMWAMPFGVGLTLFCSDLVDFGIGQKWRPAVVLLQVYGLTAAIDHIGYNWDAYMRASNWTRPIAVASMASMVTFLAAGLPLLVLDGLRGLAYGVALSTAANMVCRAHYLRQLFRGFAFGRHMLRAIAPTVPAATSVLIARLVEQGPRTAVEAASELALYCVVTVAATLLLEGRLVREALSYLRAGPAPAAG